jgi:hypothetical protein
LIIKVNNDRATSLDAIVSPRYIGPPFILNDITCALQVDGMLPPRKLNYWLLFGLLALGGATGCVERRMVIVTDPYPVAANAIVYDERNQPIGGTPVDKPFTYYGKYRFRIVKDGFETLDVEQNVRAPWYEWPGLDFISENLIPWTIRDVRPFRYTLQPAQVRPPENLLREGEMLRDYARTIGAPIPDLNAPGNGPITVLGGPTP